MTEPTPRHRRGEQQDGPTPKQQGCMIVAGVYIAALVALVACIVAAL